MSWTYEVSSGRLLDPAGTLVGTGYSGQPPYVNSLESEPLHDLGPIPEGLWKAVEMIPETTAHGPYAIRLEPAPETQTFLRSGFMMHGDSIDRPGYASDGCIIMSRDVRQEFWDSQDHDLQVISGLETT